MMSLALDVATLPSAPSAPAERERQVPFPVRFWWLKRLTLLCLLLAGSLAGLRLWWGWEAERRLGRALAPVVAGGWPVRGRDMNPGPVSEQANAAAYLRKAAAAVDPANDSPAASSVAYPSYPPFGAQWEAAAEKSVAGSARTFPLARQARAFEQVDWGWRMRRPATATLLPHLNEARHLANTVGDAAMYAHVNGDDAAALETVRDVRHIAAALGGEPFVISHLVAVGVEALALSRLQVIAPGMRIAPEGSPGDAPPRPPATLPAGASHPLTATTKAKATPRAASRGQVRGLIAELLDERDVAASLQAALAGERATQLDMADWMGESAAVLRPMFRLDALRMLEQDDGMIAAATQPTLPAAKAVLAGAAAARPPPAAPPPGARLFGGAGPRPAKRLPINYTRMLSAEMLPAPRIIDHSFRVRVDRRMTAVSLAAQLYRADAGRWPAALEALVPRYLPEVPRDLLAADGRPLKYLLVKNGLPGGGDRPVVYSVGGNGVDDTPDATALPTSPWAGWHNGRDEYRDIARWPPTPTSPGPASRPVKP